jgi:hypothetical protein
MVTPSSTSTAGTSTIHAGTLAGGETIVLACTDENAQPVEHVIELLAVVEGAPDQAAVALDQQVELALWVGISYEFGTLAWTLRDSDQDLLLLYYDGPYLPTPSDEYYTPPPEHLAPLVVDVNHEVCPWIVIGETTGNSFAPFEDCYRRDTALRLDLGSGVAEVQSGSAGAIPGGGHAIVATSLDNDYTDCGWAGGTATDYAFTIVR